MSKARGTKATRRQRAKAKKRLAARVGRRGALAASPRRAAVTEAARAAGPLIPLRCGRCGREGRYRVGTVMVGPPATGRSSSEWPSEEHFGFRGYFRCEHCDGGGPWSFTDETHAELLPLVQRAAARPGEGPVQLAVLQLFDGTVVRYASEAEAHLLRLIEERPDDPFLHDRLANVYEGGGRPDLARPAYERAAALDPGYAPALFSLGQMQLDAGRLEESAELLHRALRAARRTTGLGGEERRLIARGAIESLLEIHERSGGRIDFLPSARPGEAGGPRKTAKPDVGTYDLSREDDWERLVGRFL